MLIIPLFVTAPHVLLDSETPEGITIPPPSSHEPLSEGFILIILDGVGEGWMLNEESMPLLNERRESGATLHLRTGPLTLSATCVSEIMNGVPNSPSDGLRNFNLEHPGGDDAWTLASSNNPLYDVGLVGSYVFGNMYGDMQDLQFTNTFLGHADYYQGDEDTADVLFEWFENDLGELLLPYLVVDDNDNYIFPFRYTDVVIQLIRDFNDEILSSDIKTITNKLIQIPQNSKDSDLE